MKDVLGRVAKHVKSFLSNTNRLVLAIGALAGAVAAVIALLPKAPETYEASFTNITAEPGVSLEHYDAEVGGEGRASLRSARPSASTGSITYRLAADTSAAAGFAKSGTEAATETSKASSSASTAISSEAVTSGQPASQTSATSTSLSTANTSSTTSTSPSGSNAATGASSTISGTETSSSSTTLVLWTHSIGGADVAEGTGAQAPAERAETVEALERSQVAPAKECLSPCETRWVVGTHHTSSGLNPIIDQELFHYSSPSKAAHALAARFASCRLEVKGHRQSPLGAMVTYDLTVNGFAGRWLTVSWSLESIASGQEVPRCWWEEVSVEQIRPFVNHRSFAGRFWVPMPRRSGEYRIHLALTDREGKEYQSGYSEPPIH